KVAGREPPKTTFQDTIDDIKRALGLAWRNFYNEFFLCFAASWIPVAGSLVSFFISAFYYGFGFMDYTMERKRMDLDQSVDFARKHRGLCVGLGTICQLGMMVPFVGWMIMPTYATVASTLEVMRITDGPINTSGPAEEEPAGDAPQTQGDSPDDADQVTIV
ncbi:MAG: EI24 domain-containing protein, partial [Bacteroidota bacterium]